MIAVDSRWVGTSRDHGTVKRRTAVLLLAIFAVAAGCSSDDDRATTTPATTEAPATSDVAVTTEPELITVGEWTSIPGGDDCRCADGSPFEIWERPADPTKVMLYFEGGGACFSAETCAPYIPTFTRNLELGEAPDPGGVFDVTKPENPIADY